MGSSSSTPARAPPSTTTTQNSNTNNNYGKVGNFLGYNDFMRSETLQLGDRIEFKRGIFTHWAIYIGNGEIVEHVTYDGPSKVIFGSVGSDNQGDVRQISLREAAGDSEIRINNGLDKKFSPLSPNEIVNRAKSKIGQKGRYHLQGSNCEDLASWARNDRFESIQAEMFLTPGQRAALDASDRPHPDDQESHEEWCKNERNLMIGDIPLIGPFLMDQDRLQRTSAAQIYNHHATYGLDTD